MKRISLSAICLATCLFGCGADDIDSYIRGIAPLPTDDPQVVEGEKSAPMTEGEYSCTIQDYSETRQYDEIVAFAANSDSMWPGSILRGDSVYTGLFTQAVFDRKPLGISVSLENLAGSPAATIEAPTLSKFREALNSILSAEITGATPANIFADIQEVHSEEQLAIAVGAGVSWAGLVDVSTSFNFNDQTKRSRYVVKFVQSYYTVDIDQPGKPSDFFANSVKLDDVVATFDDGNPPVYVSSITYGRMVFFTFESNFSNFELGSALEFAYKGGADVSGDVSVTYKEMLSETQITAYILGGSGNDAVQVIDGYEALQEFIKGGGDYTRDSPGAPIAYKLAYLADNSPARLSFTQDYQVKECTRVSQKLHVTLDSIQVLTAADEVGGGGNLEIYGQIKAAGEDEAVLLDLSAEEYITIDEGQTYTNLSGEGIIHVNPQPGQEIELVADLSDEDDLNGDDDFPVVTFVASYDTGWRRVVEILATQGGSEVLVTLSIQPI